MIYERLILMRDLMHSDGSIYVHCGRGGKPSAIADNERSPAIHRRVSVENERLVA